ncbi:MAG: hypothetical protein E5V56_08435, partial [Mesorhizobium sp.]
MHSSVETIIASAYPHLEEAFNVAELLFPRLGLQGELPPQGTRLGSRIWARRRCGCPKSASDGSPVHMAHSVWRLSIVRVAVLCRLGRRD